MTDKERRRHFRLPKEAQITCQELTYPLGSAPEVSLQMVDVSEGGVRFDAPQALAVGALLQVALVLQGWHRHSRGFFRFDETDVSKPLTAIGRVARCTELEGGSFEVGVEFLDIWDDHWQAMRSYLEQEKE